MVASRANPRFRRLQKISPDYSPSTITQYESERTGMRVVVVDQEGPKLHGYFVLATEIHDDSGAPHTLEHLCFMGSKNYKYKGFLDKLATRAYSNTNAWTATDHTAYTLETAGWAGFAQILPVYLEHVVLPTLTDSGCTTEVHHIDGNGNDAGVVYSEMQGVQNMAAELIELRSKRILYPEGVGFRYETGGMMEQLRVLTSDRIREFHRDMYQPRNLCLALFGEVNYEELLAILDDFESSIISDIPSPDAPFKRPWINSKQTPALTESTLERVEFPEEDESFGEVDIRFLGPDCSDALPTAALSVALLYLAGSSAAVLDNALVEKEQLASGVYFTVDSRPRTEIAFSMSGVETGRLEEVEKRFFEVLKEAVEKSLDMKFMRDCIDRQVRTYKFNAEATPTAFADAIISDYLFGKRDGSTLESLQSLKQYTTTLVSWSEQQWKDFLKQYISDAPHVSILGVPSARLSEKLKTDEARRIEQQKTSLGPDGLKKMQKKLDQAKAENDLEIPRELLGQFKVPSTDSIHFVTTSGARAGLALEIGKPNNRYQNVIDKDAGNVALFLDFEHIPTNFARVNMIISTETLPDELRPLLSIYMEAFFNLPVKRGSNIIDFEQVVVELERDTVGYNIDSAGSLGNSEGIRVSFQVELEKYKVAIKWLSELLYKSIFDVERLKAINTRLLADVPDAKRSGDDMMTAVRVMTHLAPKSIGRARSTLVKALYLRRIKQLLATDPDQVVRQLERLRGHLCRFENYRVLVITDLDQVQEPVSAWDSFLEGMETNKKLAPVGKRIDRLSAAGKTPGSLAYVVPMPTIDSSFAYAAARGPTSYDDPKMPAVMVAMAYMNAVEGPLWVAVRGTGLAYGTNMGYDIDSGYIHLDVYRSPDAYKAFEASQKVVRGHMMGEIEFDPLMLEGAISSIVVAFANEQQTLASAAGASFVRAVMKGLPEDHMERLLKKVRAVEVEDIKDALKSVVYDMFTPGTADIFITCAPGLKEAIAEGLKGAGFLPEIHDLNHFQDDYGLKTIDDDEDDGEDEEDDEQDDESEDVEGSEGFEIVDGNEDKMDEN
ncbi:Metalloenzyme, LuxS/M16 peptidase-like protein [Exophiala viscosa]|uniref:Metalloenzyme, LuxS/M16 peptidase-like protein n=2 Tax=Exophiala viscosa TaxID=2486360 RepID=A0AAN6DWZ8_9EURO|nr:Metalloenzyme, LuxS/M16 peptidase-like protein [Exophiala viscosa]